MKKCIKCNEQMPFRMKVDDKWRNLQNRKYCLTCSPWGTHNTKKIEKPEYNGIGKECCKCKEVRPLSDFWKKNSKRIQSFCKFCQSQMQVASWQEKKKEAILYKGGKCSKCGYNQNYAAMDFHHNDPKEKEYDWYKLRLRSWDDIKKELDKCVLLCKNCHSELHNQQAKINLK